MKVLGIESASLTASVALVTDDILTGEYTVNFKKTHSQTLLPMLMSLGKCWSWICPPSMPSRWPEAPAPYRAAHWSGHSQRAGLALKKPLIHVPTVDALAFNLWGAAPGLPYYGCQAKSGIHGIYRLDDGFTAVMEQTPMIWGFGRCAECEGGACNMLGDGCPVYQEVIRSRIQVPWTLLRLP